MFTVDVIRALPILATARILIELERRVKWCPWGADFGRGLDERLRTGGGQCEGKSDILDQDRPWIAEIPEAAPMRRAVWVRQRDQKANGWKAGEEVDASREVQRPSSLRDRHSSRQPDDASQRAPFFDVHG